MSRISQASQAEVIRPIRGSFLTSQSNIVQLGRRIGIGAEGEVYEIQDSGDLVAKVYHEPPPAEKAEKLVALSSLGNDRLFNLSAWPVDVLLDAPGGEIAGFVMKKISGAEEVHALHSPKSRLQKFPEASWSFLIYVAANIARAVAVIHEHGFVIGDLNPKNILITRKATVYLLDVDSFQVSVEGRTYRCDAGFAEYTPPELQGVAFRDVDRAQEHDCFGLAVVIFQLLFMGRHPFSGRYLGAGEMPLERAIRESRFAYGADAKARRMRQPPGALELDSLPSVIVDLFRRAFLTNDRPQSREWVEPLDALAKSLKMCALHSGHYYYKESRDCPWCEIETHARVRLFNFLLPVGDTQREHFRLDEIWKEIVSVKPPTPSAQDKLEKAPAVSSEVAGFAEERRSRLIASVAFSSIVGLLISLLAEFPLAFFLLSVTALLACSFAKTKWPGAGKTPQLLQNQQDPPDDPFVRKQWDARWKADHKVRQIQVRWEKEAGDGSFLSRLDDLRTRKETYENLPKFRRFKIQQLEAEARKNQLNEFLNQFAINDAEIDGIVSPIKNALLSHGVETAADVVEEVKRIPSVGRSQSERLLEWRRDLERNFVFDPGKGVAPEARVKAERDVDTIRLHLEGELIGGPHYLRRMKFEIEASRLKLKPALLKAHQELAQAEKDLEVASKRNSPLIILTVLIIAFFCGLILDSIRPKPTVAPTDTIGYPHPPPLPRDSGAYNQASSEQRKMQEASDLYLKGKQLSGQRKFAEAVKYFQRAVEIDGNLKIAYEELGYALYHLNKYMESAEASKAAIRLGSTFTPFYNLGLVYVATENWQGAMLSFQRAIELRVPSSEWKDEHIEAYYYLGVSLVKVQEIHKTIQSLKREVEILPVVALKRFELANLYLCVGNREAAMEQYQLLKESDPALAKELLKLVKIHGVRKLA